MGECPKERETVEREGVCMTGMNGNDSRVRLPNDEELFEPWLNSMGANVWVHWQEMSQSFAGVATANQWFCVATQATTLHA